MVNLILFIIGIIIYAVLTNLFINYILSQIIEAKHIHNANPFPMTFLLGWITALLFYGLLPNDTTLITQVKR